MHVGSYTCRDFFCTRGTGDRASVAVGVCVLREAMPKCEDCRDKLASFWLPDERKKRWCAGCAKEHNGSESVANSGKKCEGCHLKQPTFGMPSERERRWCANPNCLKITPDKDLPRCSQCLQVAYCELPDEYVLKHMHHPRRDALLGKPSCQLQHWKGGHKSECKCWVAEAAEGNNEDEAAGGEGGMEDEEGGEGGERGMTRTEEA